MQLEDIYFNEMQFSEFVNDLDASKQCAKIAENFAIGFGVWISVNCTQSNSKDAWWIHNSNWVTTDELLEIYKKTL